MAITVYTKETTGVANTFTDNSQNEPGISKLPDGGYIVVWQSQNQDGSGYGVYAQRFDATGTAQGAEIQVNTTTASDQSLPVVTTLSGGGLVIAWTSDGQDGGYDGIYAQRFDENGVPQGGEIQVNSYTTLDQYEPSIAALSDGGFVVAWTSIGQDGGAGGIYAQRFDANGTAQGSEFQVNTFTSTHQGGSAVVALADGRFLVTWDSGNQDETGPYNAVYGQIFAANGSAIGDEFRVNTYNENHQQGSAIVALADGGFVVSWMSWEQDGSSNGVYGQRYANDGTPSGGEFRINGATTGLQGYPSMVATPDGGYVVAWYSLVSPTTSIFARRYGPDGSASAEFLVESAGLGGGWPQLALLDSDTLAITWVRQDTTSWDIYHQVLSIGTHLNVRTNTVSDATQGDDVILSFDGGLTVGDVVDGSGGIDTIRLVEAGTLDGRNGTLTSIERFEGSSGDDTIYGNANNDILDGAAGADGMFGGQGDDTYVVDNVNDTVTENPNEGIDLVEASISYTLGANVENLTLTGDANAHIDGTGNALGNSIRGTDGNNILDGGAGADILIGQAGDDIYIVDNANDSVTEYEGEGIDEVRAGMSFTLGEHIENLTLTGTGNINGTGNALDNVLTGNSGNNTLDGAAGADTIAGDEGDDVYVVDDAGDSVTESFDEGTDEVRASISFTLGANFENLTLTGTDDIDGSGNDLANTITGNAGANTLDGGEGADTMAGGDGDDVYVVDNAGDTVTENSNAGTDEVRSSISFALGANFETLTLTGTADIDGTGNGLANTLTGNSGANTLDGGAGADTMAGGAGDDLYIVDNAGDTVTEDADAGEDEVRASVSFILGGNIETLVLTGSDHINGTGNELANTLTGNVGNNTLDGAAGADIMAGGAGDDVYVVDNAGDVVTENADAGTDEVRSAISFTLGAHFETLVLTGSANINGTGNAGNNTITGNGGNNTLDGAAGADTMAGGGGDDIYIVDDSGDVVIENPDEGHDEVRSSVSFTLGANIETLVLTGSANSNGTGNTLANLLKGNSGANILNGAAGADTMIGFAGDDTYVIDDVGDVVTESANQGIDTIRSSISYILGANFEHLTLLGTAAINGTGNALANTLTGNSGNNILNGGAGIDRLVGGLGNDTYHVETVGDTIVERSNQGTDLVYSTIDYTLSASVENLTLQGTGNLSGTGNTLNNIIIGTSGNNTLTGLAGADTLTGGLGDDTYDADALDTIIELVRGGTDTVQIAATYTLSDNIEILRLMGTADYSGNGNALANSIYGNASGNILDGKAGADTLYGGKGDDVYVFDNTRDRAIEFDGEGSDLISASFTFSLASLPEIEKLKLTGTAAANATGNSERNRLVGNSAVNIIDGKLGGDTLTGGAGADKFQFTTALSASNIDHISDFVSGTDKIVLENGIMKQLGGTGAFNAANFVLGTRALDAADRLIYEIATGGLYYDADGSGAGAKVQILVLENGTRMLAGDILVI